MSWALAWCLQLPAKTTQLLSSLRRLPNEQQNVKHLRSCTICFDALGRCRPRLNWPCVCCRSQAGPAHDQLHPQSLWSSDAEDAEAAIGKGAGPSAQRPAGQREAVATSSHDGAASRVAAGAAGAPTVADMSGGDNGAGGTVEVSG